MYFSDEMGNHELFSTSKSIGKTLLKDGLDESVTTLKRDIKAGLNKTTKVSNDLVLQLGTIEAMLTDEYDEATLSDEEEKSILSEDYRSILITNKENEPFS